MLAFTLTPGHLENVGTNQNDKLGNSGASGMSKRLLSFTAVYVVVAASFLLLPSVVTQAELIHLGREDGVFENIGAVSFLVASTMFLLTFKMSYGQKHIFLGISTRGNVYFGMLALLMFICFGEEISCRPSRPSPPARSAGRTAGRPGWPPRPPSRTPSGRTRPRCRRRR